MSTLNLGPIEADTLLVFGGPYGNLEATQALLIKAQELGIEPEQMICTGDLVAYCADPEATASLLRAEKIHVIQGNCEQSLAANEHDCGCGFTEGSACATLSKSWFSYCQSKINQTTRTWFNQLPKQIRFNFGGKRFLVVHGSLTNTSQFIYASSPKIHFKQQIQAATVDCILAGHSGLPFTQIIDGFCWHNSGVIGMPANDGTSRVWYSLIKQSADTITFEHRALHYAAETAQNKMKQAGLPKEYANSLTTGLWPSLDVLPRHEARQTGRPLTEHRVEWSL
jgi:predicted phosphodiesterase